MQSFLRLIHNASRKTQAVYPALQKRTYARMPAQLPGRASLITDYFLTRASTRGLLKFSHRCYKHLDQKDCRGKSSTP